MVDISTLVNVTTTIIGGGATRLAFGRGLLVTQDELLSAGGTSKVNVFSTLDEATAVLPPGDARDAAAVWFAASPRPQSLYVGRWARSAVSTEIIGGTTLGPATSGNLDSGTAQFTLNGSAVSVDLSSADTYAAIASAIQTAVQALAGIFRGATFTYDTDHFELTLAGSDDIEGGALGAGAAADISDLLGMAAGSAGRRYVRGSNAESVVDGVQTMIDLTTRSGEPTAVMLAGDVSATDPQAANADPRELLSAWAETSELVFALRETSPTALTANEAASLSARVFAANRGRTATVYTRTGQLPDVALMARMSAMNLGSPRSLITPHAKTLPSVLPTDVTAAQVDELTRKRVSVYTEISNDGALLGGYTSRSDYWLDAIWWLIWLKAELSSAVFRAMRGNDRLTRALLANELRRVMQSGVRNGGIQPGRSVSATTTADIIATTGNLNFNGVLESGWTVWVDPSPTAQDLADRIARFRIWIAGSPAIHRTFGDVRFEN